MTRIFLLFGLIAPCELVGHRDFVWFRGAASDIVLCAGCGDPILRCVKHDMMVAYYDSDFYYTRCCNPGCSRFVVSPNSRRVDF